MDEANQLLQTAIDALMQLQDVLAGGQGQGGGEVPPVDLAALTGQGGGGNA